MKPLQRTRAQRSHDVGKIDGTLGAGPRSSVQNIQEKRAIPDHAWPTPALLNAL